MIRLKLCLLARIPEKWPDFLSALHQAAHSVHMSYSGDVELDPLTKGISEGQAPYLGDPNLVEMPLKEILY